MKVVAYRHAAYDSPWWAYPSSREGRFHRAGIDTVQYLALHPLAPAAEMLRHNLGPTGNADDALLNLWAAAVDLEDIVVISFNDCASHGITADELVGDDYTPTQVLADRAEPQDLKGSSSPLRPYRGPRASFCSVPDCCTRTFGARSAPRRYRLGTSPMVPGQRLNSAAWFVGSEILILLSSSGS